jgi:23S rRNA pseudouridine1911/1915/1917 synthase
LDAFLVEALPGLSRRRAAELIAAGRARVDGRRAAKGARLAAGQRVELAEAPAIKRAAPDADCPLEVVYEDAHLIAVNKPAGRHSAPQRASDRGAVAQALLARFPEMAGVGFSPWEPGLCHRLDFWTSGVLLAAKNQPAFAAARRAFERHAVRKEYLALCAGSPPDSFAVDAPIAHPSRRSQRVIVGSRGRGAVAAKTEFTVAQRSPGFVLVRAACSTGAMHQVRAHAAHAGHPLLGDELYGGPREPDGRFWLHAAVLALAPLNVARVLQPAFAAPIEAPLPRDFLGRIEHD